MKTLSTIALIAASLVAMGQTEVTIAPVWVAYDTATRQATGYQWHLQQGDPGTTLDDSSRIKLNGTDIYNGWNTVLILAGGQDTSAMFYFTANSIHPCSDSVPTGSVHWMDFYNDESIAIFKTNGFDMSCQSMNNLLRSHVWAKQGYNIPSSWWDQWQQPTPTDTTDTTGGTPIDTTTVGIYSPMPEGLRVWPNPANGTFYVHAPGPCEMTMQDIKGRIMLSRSLHEGENRIDAPLPKGIYFVRTGENVAKVVLL